MQERKVIRLQKFDYSSSKYYFVTILPDNKKYKFSEIINARIKLTGIGKIVKQQWLWLFDRYPYIKLDEYVIMPDHFHGIIRYLPENVGDGRDHRLRYQKIKPLPEIIGAFKTTSSKRIHLAGYTDFKWRRSFNDRVLREYELGIKREYIHNNPLKNKRSIYKYFAIQ